MSQHNCENALVQCIDFRFREATERFATKLFGTPDFDLYSWPGSAKKIADDAVREILLGQISVTADLHNAKKLVFVSHTDCGAYGGKDAFESADAEREKLTNDLRKAREIINGSFPSIEVELYLLDTYRGNSFDKVG